MTRQNDNMSSLLSDLRGLEEAAGPPSAGTRRASYAPKTAANLNAAQRRDMDRDLDTADRARRLASDTASSTMRNLKQKLEQLETTKGGEPGAGANAKRGRLSLSLPTGPQQTTGLSKGPSSTPSVQTAAASADAGKTPRTLTKSQFTLVPRKTSETKPPETAGVAEEEEPAAETAAVSKSPPKATTLERAPSAGRRRTLSDSNAAPEVEEVLKLQRGPSTSSQILSRKATDGHLPAI